MNISKFFIERPIFASVIAVFIVLIGAFAYPQLSLSQYPEIAPPTISVTATFPGASAETMADTVATPIEQEINGVEDMLYMSSSSTSAGLTQITVTFKPGTDLDAAQVLVQNRVALAEPRLPEEVRQIGVTVAKQSSGFLMIVALTSTDPNLNIDYVGNFANSNLRDRLLRLEGVGGVQVFGGGNYSMRVWIDPDKAAARNLTADEIVAALRTQNVQVAGGAVGQPPYGKGNPAFQLPVQVQGRLTDPDQFADIVIKTDATSGAITRVRDIGRVELGSQEYGIEGSFSGRRGVALAIIQQPGSNALDAAELVLKEVEAASKDFPPGIVYSIPYNPTEYVSASVEAVQETLLEAIVLVMIVVLVFLQTWRAAVIPIVAIPIALVGTFAVQLALGFSINSLSLFALVLAVGIVVDDAIVVVEAVEKHIRDGLSPREAAHRTMQEVSGALIAIGLVLTAVFIPTAFVSGIPGIFYRQFAVTIAAASVISLIVSLTLSPAMAALLLKPHHDHDPNKGPWVMRVVRTAGNKFNGAFDWLSDRYGRMTGRLIRMATIMLVVYAGLLALTGWRLGATPTGFIPEQDQGVLIGVVQLPPGSSLERTSAVLNDAYKIARGTDGVVDAAVFAGLDGASFSQASNSGTMFLRLADWGERSDKGGQSAAELSQLITGKVAGAIQGAQVFFISPPAVPGLGTGSGFVMMLQDRSGAGYKTLEGLTFGMMGAAAQKKEVTQVFSLFNTGSPRIQADVDRDRAQLLGVQPSQVYSALGTYLGSTYVNDFNLLGRTFRVTAQAEPSARDDLSDIGRLQVRSASGAMVPLASVATLRNDSGPTRVVRYNMFPAVELQGQAAPGVSSGVALRTMETLAQQTLPPGFSYEWTGIAFQEQNAGGSAVLIFLLAVVFVFLVLAAQYEALTLPMAVILIVPMCILAAMIGVGLRGMDNNILTQVGLVVLVALAAKNAILIVEFAKQGEEEGLDVHQAAATAARQRLRPILMTSFAFIFGVIPLAIAVGPGAEMRQSLGTAVTFGMIGVTLFGLIFTPIFYVVMRRIGLFFENRRKRKAAPNDHGTAPHGALPEASH
ncbi:efflux RND transporter permease subunit [Sphingosinicella sp. BN140058]|uniref:efflux RND transporter permease subunit n=1 Tax=Sphingosinicella sp. BN140058 TaxID=1892855 RepID=UPI00101166D4|nr:multidrug efflux RND transporter permease subunit [Sphingosinicella sp. BN140058]QAY79459.1 multidrug efflux RND transporter permease subunit [Sphingosinicella sp. BN140058]